MAALLVLAAVNLGDNFANPLTKAITLGLNAMTLLRVIGFP
jgi:hypothetical protein